MGKLTLREIRRSLGRFLAIAAIVALGVGFFCGLRLTKTAMVRTLDAYAEAQQMYDFRLVSTIGFDETDAAKIAADSRVAACEGTKSADALTSLMSPTPTPPRLSRLQRDNPASRITPPSRPEQSTGPAVSGARARSSAAQTAAPAASTSEQRLGMRRWNRSVAAPAPTTASVSIPRS